MPKLAVDDLNPAFLKVQYAVRGELAIRAEEYRVQLKTADGHHGLPFNKVISSNIGNPQQTGLDQPPITFIRQVGSLCRSMRWPAHTSNQFVGQVAALMEWPALADLAKDAIPTDVIARAKELQAEIGSIGAYSHSQGVPFIRKNVANFIEGRSTHISRCRDLSHTHSLIQNVMAIRPTQTTFS